MTILAIDLGGTQLRAGLAEGADPAKVDLVGTWPAPTDLAAFEDLLLGLLAEHRSTRLGCGIPGYAQGSVSVWVPNLPYLDGYDFARLGADLEIGLGNDAQLALLAEREAGAANGMSDALLLAIGTGIGSAVLAAGRIVRGSHGGACSFGWAAAEMNDPGNERSGWLERHASGRALDKAAQLAGFADGPALIAAAAAGNRSAGEALAKPMLALGTALAGAVALLDPEAVILAGGVAAVADVLADPIATAARRHLPPHLRDVEIRSGSFGPRAGLVGAAFAGRDGRHWGQRHG